MTKKIGLLTTILLLGLLPLAAFALTPSLAWNGSSYGVVEAKDLGQTSVITFTRVGTDGKKLQTDAAVTTATSPIRFPTLHWTGLNYMVFWTQVDGSGTFINSRRIDGAGKPVTSVIHIHRSDFPITSFESVSVEQNPHHFVLTWDETLGKDHSRSMLLRVDTAGAKLMEAVLVNESPEPALPAPAPQLQPGPTQQHLEQALGRTPSSGTPPYPTQPSITAHSLTSLPEQPAYGFLQPTVLPLVLPSFFKPQTAQAAPQEIFYPFSPAPTFGQGTVRPQGTTTLPAPTTTSTSALPAQPSSSAVSLALGAGDLFRGSSPSVWRYGDDGKRHLFPDDFTFKSWSNQYAWVISASDAEVNAIPEGDPILIYPGYAIVGFTGDANLYTVTRVGVLQKLQIPAEAQQKYGTQWKTRIHIYPAELKTRYQFEPEKPKNTRAKKPVVKRRTVARRAPQNIAAIPARRPATKVQPKNLRARNVL